MPARSPLPDVAIPHQDIWGFLFERKDREFPDDKVIFLDPYTNRSYTYAQTKNVATDFGKGLKSLWEWQKGDVLCMYTPNTIDFPPVIWGCHWAGGTVTTANPAYTASELAFQLKDSGAKAIATQLPWLENARVAAKAAGIAEDRIVLVGDQRDGTHRFKHFSSIQNLSGTTRYRRTKLDPEKDLSFLPYSSGTTGKPKGVMLNHRNIVADTLMLDAVEGPYLSWKGGPDGKGDKLMGVLPFFHIYGLTVLIHQCFLRGYTLVVMPKFDLEDFCRITQDVKVTMAYVAPPIVLHLSKAPVVDKYDISSIKMINSGAAPLTKELVDALWQRCKIKVKQGYGLSETSPTTHTQRFNDWYDGVGSVGIMLPNQTAKFMSPEEKEVPAGQAGELWVKGPNVFQGYMNNPEGTANSLTPDGYFKTGDVGYLDSKDNFFITDRVKELIKYKGFQVPPAELEGKLQAHAKVGDVAVIGVYDERQATEVPRAYVVVKGAGKEDRGTAKEIEAWMQNEVANHKRLRGGVRFVKEVPKSPTGKILRRVLKEQAKKEDEGPMAKL
ncbi:MAG: hypothetical protein M1831_002544 [Alyxoria varia]|nr:MAG: hypothetical protein M1831_002544 [Alyxoria varia]